MKKGKVFVLLFFFFFFSFSYADDFDLFEKFDKEDKETFNSLIEQARECIKNWQFYCARDALKKAKNYITSKKDKQKINQMYGYLKEEERRKEEQERLEEMRRNAITITLLRKEYKPEFIEYEVEVRTGYGDTDRFLVFATPHGDGTYNIGSFKFSSSGSYSSPLGWLSTSHCGRKTEVNSLEKAVFYYLKCMYKGSY